MKEDIEMLPIRISIVMRKHNYTFLTSLYEFQSQLKKYFSYEYNLDQIEDALYKLEETFIIKEAQNRDDNPDVKQLNY